MHLPRHSEIWFPSYVVDRVRRTAGARIPIRRVWLLVVDHFEPLWRGPDEATARHRVAIWRDRWPQIAAAFTDSAGRQPKYSFFYPEEEYRREFVESLAEMTRAGIADVEIHIHHDREGRENFIQRMTGFCRRLSDDHGLLRKRNGRLTFGFVHGDWALDNSRPDGRACGLNDEITILQDLGCYADFTMPAGSHPSQSKMLNTIYWCKDDPTGPKSYDRGIRATTGGGLLPDLLMVPGPLGLRWRERLLPRLECGEIAAQDPPTAYRAQRWLELAPRIGGDLFLKLHTHGAQERNSAMLLNGGLNDLFTIVSARAAALGAQLFFASPWEIYCAVEALCTGKDPVAAAFGQTAILRPTETQRT